MQPRTLGYWSEERSRRWLSVVVIGVFVVVAMLSAMRHLNEPPIQAEAVVLATAETLGDAVPYYTEIDTQPPLLPVMIKAVSHIIPLPAGARILGAALFAIGLVVLFLLGQRVWGTAEGFLASVLMLAAPYFLIWSGRVLTEIPAAALAIASLYLAHLATDGRSRYAFLGGVLLAATFLVNWPAVLVGLAVAVLVVMGALRVRPALLYLAGFAVGIAPYFTWAWLRFDNPLHALLHVTRPAAGGGQTVLWTSFAGTILLICAPVAVVGLVLYALNLGRSALKPWLRTDLPLLVWALALPVFLLAAAPRNQSAVAAAIPPLFLVAARGWASTFRDRSAAWRVTAMVLGLGAFGAQVVSFDAFMLRSRARDDQRRVSRDMGTAAPAIREAVAAGDVLYSNHLPPLLAWWTKLAPEVVRPRDERFFERFPGNMSKDGVFIRVAGTSTQPREEWLNERPEFKRVNTLGRIVIYEYRVPSGTMAREEVRRRLDVARQAYKGGNWEIVVKNLDGFSGGDSGVGCILGWSLYKLGRVEESARVFGELLDVAPGDNCGLTGSGYGALRLGDPATAEASFAAVLARKPDSVDALVGSGMAALRQQRYEAAVRAFRRVLELSPGHSEAQELLARAEAGARRGPSPAP